MSPAGNHRPRVRTAINVTTRGAAATIPKITITADDGNRRAPHHVTNTTLAPVVATNE
jgi:hypothetical protein